MMKKIGGYDSFKYVYNYHAYENGKDSPFTLTIFGDTACVELRGKIHKEYEIWKIIDVDTTYKSY